MRQGFNQHMGEKVDHIYHAITHRHHPRLPPGFCDVRSPTGCLSIILYERGYSSCIRSIGERVPKPGPQCASDGVSSVSADCTKVFRQ
ncbi:hypothetical protein ACOMHN_045748 [Nucella lapillus]